MSRLTELNLLLNERCNLRCGYCHFRAPDELGVEMEPGQASRAVSLFFEAARSDPSTPRTLCFNADGEVTLARDLLGPCLVQASKLRDEAGLEGVTLALVTNATLVNRSLASMLERLGVVVTVSIDGPASCHDHYRRDTDGAGSHAAVVRGLGHLHRAGVPASLRAVHGPDTVHLIAESWQDMRGHAPPRPIKLRAQRLPGPPWFEASWAHRYAEASHRAVRHMLRSGAPWQGLPDHARHMAAWMRTGQTRGRCCQAGHGMLWLTPSGALVPCGLMSRGEHSMGNMADIQTLEQLEALLDHPLSVAMRDGAPSLHEPCRSCRWLPACGGGCPMEALDQDLQPVPPPLCKLYRSLGDLLEEEL